MKKLIVLLLAAAACAPVSLAQGLTTLSGSVSDPSGAVIPGATLMLENTQTGTKRETISSSAGSYTFAQVQPGSWKIIGKASGFSDVIVNNVQLQVNTPATVNIQFEKVGTVAETVSVSAEAVQINTTDASLGNAIGSRPIVELPLFARNPAQLLAFQPGVSNFGTGNTDYVGANHTTSGTSNIDERNGAVNGGKSDQSNITLDGVDVLDQQTRRAFKSVLRVTLDSVQEFRTTTANANADQGRTSGAQIALVTRSGSNEIHGALYEYHRNTVTAANSYFNNASGVKRPALLINVFGARVGGPIVRNRLFYFANYEGRRDASASNIVRTVPSELLKQGIVQYRRVDGSIGQLNPDDLRTRVDPARIGVNQASQALLRTYPTSNDSTQGDGLNIVGYRFTAPQRTKFDTYITKFDWNVDSAFKHTVFLRGNLQNDRASGLPQFPGEPPNSVGLDNSKGFATGLTSLIATNFISTFRYGFTRSGAESTGVQSAPAATFRTLTARYGLTTGIARIIPTHNITQDFTWTKNRHDVRFGGTLRFISNQSRNFVNSFHSVTSNSSWLRQTGSDLQTGVPDLNPTFRVAYNDAVMAVLGILSQGTARYNYLVDGTVLAVGAPTSRNFKGEEYEWYVQDTWKVTRSLTVTAGLRHSLMPPVYEANGQQLSANVSLGDWFNRRGGLGQQGKSQREAGAISFLLAGGQGGRPLYDFHKKNFAPRVSLAYSPEATSGIGKFFFGGPGKSSIRAGWGMFYDLFGQGVVRAYDATAFGLSTSLTNPSGNLTGETAPRFTGFYSVPPGLIRSAPAVKFPVQYPENFAITNSIDDRIKAPYSMPMNLSIQREFRGGWMVQGAYVGRLSRRSLVSRDLAMPTDLKDPASGVTYYEAATQMVQFARAGTPAASVPRIPYWENMWPGAATATQTASQRVYSIFVPNRNDATSALYELDMPDGTVCSRLGCNAMFNPQFSALGALSSVGGGSYHAMQWTLRKRMASLTADLNYTWSKSIDLSSNTEDSQFTSTTTVGFNGILENPWSPFLRRAVSDYDTRHILNGYAVWEAPVGRGKRFGGGSGKVLDVLIGGWQLAPAFTMTSGLPVSVGNGRNWPTNWNITGRATQVAPIATEVGSTKNAPSVTGNAGANLFADANKGLAAYTFTLPGQIGQRNVLRGDGAFRIDLGVSKRFTMPYKETHTVQFRWETFNLTNTARFNVSSLSLDLGNSGTFGKYSGTLGEPRQMQFALRYEF